MEKEKLERISHLSRLSRERNLTDEEIKERMELRGQYIAEMPVLSIPWITLTFKSRMAPGKGSVRSRIAKKLSNKP